MYNASLKCNPPLVPVGDWLGHPKSADVQVPYLFSTSM